MTDNDSLEVAQHKSGSCGCAAPGALYDARFCRMWEFYLVGCEIAFRHMGQMRLAHHCYAVPAA